MKIITGYFEIYDLTTAVYFAYNNYQISKILNKFGIKQYIPTELISFKDSLKKEIDWSLKIFTTCLNELGVMTPILFPVRQKISDGEIVSIEDSLKISDYELKIIQERFIDVVAQRRMEVSPTGLRDLIKDNPEKVSLLISKINDISKDTVWFIKELIFYPESAFDFLKKNIQKILEIYERTNLRKLNNNKLRNFFSNTPNEKVYTALENFFDYYSFIPGEDFSIDKPFFVLLQNSISHMNLGLMEYPTFNLVIMGIDEINEDFANKFSPEKRLDNILKVISDSTRFNLLRYLDKNPSTQKKLVDYTGLTKSTISYHISMMRKTSIIDIDVFNNIVKIRKEPLKKVLLDLKRLFAMEDKNGKSNSF